MTKLHSWSITSICKAGVRRYTMLLLMCLIIALIGISRVSGDELFDSNSNLSSNQLPNLMGNNCGGLLEGLEGSYSYQAEEFSSQTTCVWVVKSTDGKSFLLTIDTLQSGVFFHVHSLEIGSSVVSTELTKGGREFSGHSMVLVGDSNTNFSVSWKPKSFGGDEELLTSVAYVASNHGTLSSKASLTPSNFLWVVQAPSLSAQNNMRINMKNCLGQHSFVKLSGHYARFQTRNVTFEGAVDFSPDRLFTHLNTAILIISGNIKAKTETSKCHFEALWGRRKSENEFPESIPQQTPDVRSSLHSENVTTVLPSILLATDPTGAKIYYENNKTVMTVSKETTTTGVAFDLKSRNIYWSTVIGKEFQLHRARTDGSDQELVLNGLGKVYGMAFDWLASNLYFAEFVNNRIGACHAQLGCRTILNDTKFVNRPAGLAIDPIRGVMYWTNRESGMESIARAGMDGSEPMILHDTDLGYPGGIAVDLDNGQIYWIGERKKVIETCDADGSNRKILLALDSKLTPFGIDNFDGKIYWGEFKTKKIYQFDITSGRNSSDLVLETKGYVRHIAVYHEDKQPRKEQYSISG